MGEQSKKVKALVLLSGGLDSILAAKLLMNQGIGVEGICFYSNFFGCESARKAAKQIGIKLREVSIGEEFLRFLKNKPRHGYGVGLNPCIDCHALMLKKAGEIMRSERFSFVATGEVLGERPMSQHRKALKIVEKEAGLEGHLLRPLSAKLLEPTAPEIEGLVVREKLMDISGRSRKKQMELVRKFDISDYPTPAGGCVLTQSGFVERMKDLMKHRPDFDSDDVELIKVGRHFWCLDELGTSSIGASAAQIVLGRNEEENKKLAQTKREKDIFVEPENFVGPSALVRNSDSEETLSRTKELIIRHSPKLGATKAKFKMQK